MRVAAEPLEEALRKLRPHDHLCLIHDGPREQLEVAAAFLRIGLDRGERCVYIADQNAKARVVQALLAAGADAHDAIAKGRLVITDPRSTYLRGGRFHPDRMIAFLQEATEDALAGGFRALRATGEMTWALRGDPGNERLIEYEARLNDVFPRLDLLAICQYDRARFSPETLRDVLLTHPLVIVHGMVCRNPYFVPPEAFLAQNPVRREVDALVESLMDIERTRRLAAYWEGACRASRKGNAVEIDLAGHA